MIGNRLSVRTMWNCRLFSFAGRVDHSLEYVRCWEIAVYHACGRGIYESC
jgi:hypothetical protein